MTKIISKTALVFLTVLLSILLATCKPESNSSNNLPTSDNNTSGTTDPTTNPTPPAIAGYDLELFTGNHWKYGWSEDTTSWYLSSNSTTSLAGTLTVTLGPAKIIDGKILYKVIKQTSGDPYDLRWTHLGSAGNVLYGSTDGITVDVILDAQTGYQAGGGFFANFNNAYLVRPKADVLSNSFYTFTSNTTSLAYGSSAGGCEYFSDYGTICGGDDIEKATIKDHFAANIGPVGYYYYYYNSDSQSNSGVVSTKHVGLTEYALGIDSKFNLNHADFDQRFTDNGDGTVTDSERNLMWQKTDDGIPYNWYEAAGEYNIDYNLMNKSVCGDLALAQHSDWRLPTKDEVASIVYCGNEISFPSPMPDYYRCSNFVDGYSGIPLHSTFDGSANAYWTSTTSTDGDSSGRPSSWAVDFNSSGYVYSWYYRDTNADAKKYFFARCVRDM